MNILVVHEADYIDQVVYEYQIIPELLASRGHNVYVIDFSTKKGGVYQNVKKANKKAGVTLIRPRIVNIPYLARLSASVSHFLAIGRVIQKRKIDKIILYSIPTNGIQTLFWGNMYKIPVLFRLLDVLHELVPNSLARYPIYILEKIIYKYSNCVLAVTPQTTNYALKLGANPKTTFYLPTGADFDLFHPAPKKKKLLKKYHLYSTDLVILFAGTMFRFSGLDGIIKKMSNHLPKLPNLKLVIVGRGEQEKELRRLVEKLNLSKNVIFTGFVNYKNLVEYINLADICINPFRITPATNAIFPGKIYQYTSCAKPTLATKLQGMIDIFPVNNKAGIYYYDTEDEFFKLIPKVLNKKFHNPNPSIQEITKTIEQRLKLLK